MEGHEFVISVNPFSNATQVTSPGIETHPNPKRRMQNSLFLLSIMPTI